MAAYTAISEVGRYSLGDRILVVSAVTGGIGMDASVIRLKRVENVWFQNVDDDHVVSATTYSGTAIVNEEITATKIQLMFAVGHE
jgi:hypothetical protein